jgi:hypothetical protein
MHIARRQRYLPMMLTALGLVLSTTCISKAEIYLNEIFLDPGGAGEDGRDEFIELRGTPGLSLANHYLILIENEKGSPSSLGQIENIFILGDNPNTPNVEEPYKLGGNGFLLLRQKGSLYTNIAPGTTDLVNTGTGIGYGSDAGSSIRHSDQGGDGKTENSGFTAMLIRNDGDPFLGQPFLGLDLDVGDNGLDPPATDQFDWNDNWTILDSIGIFSDAGEAGLGRTYAPINFGPEIPGQEIDIGLPQPIEFTPNIEPGAVYVGVGYEIEYVGRWGNSTGQTAADWHVSNLTDKPLSGSTGVPDYRQSGGFHDTPDDSPPGPTQRVETSQGVPYGTALLDTLGAPNLFYQDGDFDLDGDVDGRDLLIWQRHYGFGDGITVDAMVTATRAHGDANGDWKVDGLDLARWQANYGQSTAPIGATVAVPEPSTLWILTLMVSPAMCRRR